LQNTPTDPRQIEALLDFFTTAGVDCFLGKDPVDWFALTREQSRQRAQIVPAAVSGPAGETGRAQSRQQPAAQPRSAVSQAGFQPQTGTGDAGSSAVLPDGEVIAAARDLAAQAASLDELQACLAGFEGCNLKLTAKKLVFADGNPAARLMFVGEAPGRDEDLQGKPFVGRSGQLLDRMLAAIGLDRSSAYIANVVPWRPPGNRTPTPQETEICKPFIVRQIELVDPDVLVFLGAASAKTLLGVQDGIRKMRGRWMSYPAGGREIAAIATYHPAYLLRSPLEKRLSWRDFLAIKQKLAS
jgi:uracil-DNA glycosylase family 4